MARKHTVPRLGSLELKIMEAMWQHADRYLVVRDVREMLDADLAYTTVMTVMSRLRDKGLLRRQRRSRAWAYRPTMSRDAYAAAGMADALEAAEDRADALFRFLAELDPHEATTLRRLLEST